MTEAEITQAFNRFAEGKGIDLDGLSLSHFPRLLINYYKDVELPDVETTEDGDLLLFQYGTYDWGHGLFFEVDFTRQSYKSFANGEDHAIVQQRFTFYFDPQPFQNITSFDLWSNAAASLDEFEAGVRISQGYRKGLRDSPERFDMSVVDVC